MYHKPDCRTKIHVPRAQVPLTIGPCVTARFQWKYDDPEIISDVLFAVANVVSIARTTYLMPAFEVLGPLQISLGRMVGDITRFLVLFMLVSRLFWALGYTVLAMQSLVGTYYLIKVENILLPFRSPSSLAPTTSKDRTFVLFVNG